MDMADRISIDIEGLRDRIESAKDDPMWQELSLAKKVRFLLQERLSHIDEEKAAQPQEEHQRGS
ncbi:MAG: hypothetical protein AAGG51_21160 [Cyanobacteria bacterium P01_G01_bin.54]